MCCSYVFTCALVPDSLSKSATEDFRKLPLRCWRPLLTHTFLQLSKYPALNNFEKQTSVPKVYAFLGLVGIYFFLVFFNIGGQFLVNFAGFIIPGYYSLDALFSTSKIDDTQWLTYWVVYAFLNVLESLVNAVYWFRMSQTFMYARLC